MKNFYALVLFVIFFCQDGISQSNITWNMGMNIASNIYGNIHPRMALDRSGNPMVIFGGVSGDAVMFSKWNGTGFSSPVPINPMWLQVASTSWMGPDIAAHGDTVYVVAKREPESADTNRIFIFTSFNGGNSFNAPVELAFIGDSISRFPTVTTDDSGNPIVAFMKFDPAFGDARWVVSTSTDFGNTFSTDVKASGWSGVGAAVCDCCPGAIACSGNTVAMLYRDNNNNIRDIWSGISDNTAIDFTEGMGIDQQNWMLMMCPSSGPDGVIIGDTLYSTFMNGASGMSLVYYSKASVSSVAGAAGTPITGMFAGLTQQNFPRMAHSGNAQAVVWKQIVNGTDQLALKFTNNLANGFFPGYDTVDLANITNTDVALSNGNIFVVWQDDNSGTVKYRSGVYPVIPTSLIENTVEQISIFPNPAKNTLYISSPDFLQIEKYEITDCLGRIMINGPQFTDDQNIDISSLPPGLYSIIVKANNTLQAYKFIKL